MRARGFRTLQAPSALARSAEGAAYVEFLIAFLPIFIAFLSLWQLGRLYVTRLVAEHAAFAGARAAAVFVPMPNASGVVDNRLTADKRQAVEGAVYLALAPVLLRGWVASATVRFPSVPGAQGAPDETQYDVPDDGASPMTPTMVNVHVSALFACGLPPVDYFMCTPTSGGWVVPIETEAPFPYQGARYTYDLTPAKK
jgi:hypothetical protein